MSKQTAIIRFGLHQENMGCARLDKWPEIPTCLACEAMSSHSVSKNADEADDFQFLRIINAPHFSTRWSIILCPTTIYRYNHSWQILILLEDIIA